MSASSAHASLGPSKAPMWIGCPGSPRENAGLPNISSEAADEGTVAHGVSDTCLTFDMDAHDFIGSRAVVNGIQFEWTDEDADLLQDGLDYTRKQPGKFYGEHRVDLSHILGADQFGTLDRGIVAPDLITISDLKWGRGIAVSPVENKQLMLYALGFWWNVARHQSDATDFRIIIDQPRNNAGGGEWRTTLDDLLAFGEEAKRAAERTRDPNAPTIASEAACLWCLRRQAPGGCATYDRFNMDTMQAKFEDFDDAETLPALVGPRELTPERRSYILKHSKMFETWLGDLRADAMADAVAGRPVPGLKVVQGKLGPRKFIDRDAAVAALEPEIGAVLYAAPKPKTPTQLEKDLGLDDYIELVAPLVTRSEGAPILVDEADSRPALESGQGKFDEEEGN